MQSRVSIFIRAINLFVNKRYFVCKEKSGGTKEPENKEVERY
jgi:hypothetical protein